MATLSVMMDMIMAGLLLATLIYCLKLNMRIKQLQDGRSELAQIIREFDESTQRATQNINEIHAATARISENIQHKIDKASYLADDLEMLVDRASKLSGKKEPQPGVREMQPAEAAVTASVKRTIADILPSRTKEVPVDVKPSVKAAAAEAPAAAPRRRGRSRAEQDLMNLVGSKQGNEGGR